MTGPSTNPASPMVRIPPMMPMNMMTGWIFTRRPTSTGRIQTSGIRATMR